MVAHPKEDGWQAVRGSSQELRREDWAADTDPKFITRWMQRKPWERKGPPGAEDRLRMESQREQHSMMKEVKKDNEGEAKERWSQKMVLKEQTKHGAKEVKFDNY